MLAFEATAKAQLVSYGSIISIFHPYVLLLPFLCHDITQAASFWYPMERHIILTELIGYASPFMRNRNDGDVDWKLVLVLHFLLTIHIIFSLITEGLFALPMARFEFCIYPFRTFTS